MELLAFELIIIAALWGWWAWKNPKEAFIGLPILLPTYVVRTKIGPIPTTGLELAVLATVIAWIAKRGVPGLKETYKRFERWLSVVSCWLFVGLIAVFVAPDNIAAFGLYRAYFVEPLLLFFVGFDLIRTDDDKSKLASNFGFITIVVAIWAATQMITGWGIPEPWNAWPGRRAVGPFPFPNALALFVAPIAALAFADRIACWAARNAKAVRTCLLSPLLGWLTVISGIAAMALAKSEGGLIAFSAAALLALLLNKRSRTCGIVLAILGIVTILFVPQFKNRAIELALFKEWSGKVRTVMWSETLNMLKDRPIFGAGLGAYPMVIAPYHAADWMEIFQYPHNILLNLWSETGLLGVLAFGYIIVRWIRMARGKRRVVIPMLVVLLVHGLVDVPYFKNDLAIAFWLFILTTTTMTSRELHPS